MLADRDRCPGCSTPLSDATDDDKRGRWDVQTRHCNPCLHLDAARDRDGKKPQPGVIRWVVPRPD